MEGTWSVVGVQRGGRDLKTIAGMKVEIADGQWTFTRTAPRAMRSTGYRIVLDPSKKPKAIDLQIPTRLPFRMIGIYELNGDSLKVCYVFDRNGRPQGGKVTEDVKLERPKEMGSKEGTAITYTLKREKKTEDKQK
jgi:uncharacterized protein (TIGR03067 family)